MGSVGKSSSMLVNKPTSEAIKYSELTSNGATKWFGNEKNSNEKEWRNNLTSDELHAIKSYTGYGYTTMNNNLYSTPWDEIGAYSKSEMSNLYNALNKFDLKRGINVTRQTDFQIFGGGHGDHMTVDQVKNYLTKNGGVLQSDGFMSFAANDKGISIAGSGLVVHLQVPPSKGAGAYVNQVSSHKGEYEYLLNNNAVLKFDPNSVKEEGGKVHVTAQWLGQSKMQSIDPNNKSAYAKKKG